MPCGEKLMQDFGASTSLCPFKGSDPDQAARYLQHVGPEPVARTRETRDVIDQRDESRPMPAKRCSLGGRYFTDRAL